MRYDTLSSWQKALEHRGEVTSAPVTPSSVLMISSEPYTLELAWQAFLTRLRHMPRWNAQALCTFDAEESEPSAFFEELQTLPFLVPMKVILLRRAEKWSLAQRKQLDALLTRRIEVQSTQSTIQSTQEQKQRSPIYVVIMASQWHKNSLFHTACGCGQAGQALQEHGHGYGAIIEVPAAKGAQRETTWTAWVQQRMQAKGKTISFPLAKRLVHGLEDVSYLSTECDKLLSFVGERKAITEKDVEAICSLVEPESIWQLGEAIFKGDLAKALSAMHFLLDGELTPFALLASLRHQLQTGCRIAELLAAKVPQSQIAAQFPQLVGRLLDNQCRLANEYGVHAFHKALHKVIELEFDLKDRSIDPKRLVERVIFFLSQRAETVGIV